MTPSERARFIVRGRVQGVNFRMAAVDQATARGLTGRVWNRDDGAVELIAEGEPAALGDLAKWLSVGPRSATVESVERSELVGGRHFRDFAISDGLVS